MEISAPYDNAIAALARMESESDFDCRLSLFDLRARKRLADFPVMYSGGPWRYALSRDAQLCFVGCFQEHGLAAYSTHDGSERWRRKDLQILNGVAPLDHEDVVSCTCNGNELILLCAQTGRTLDIQHGIEYIYSSPFSRAMLLSARNLELHLPFGNRLGIIPRETFGELDCAFSESEIVITESGGSVRAFDLQSLKPLWTHKPPKGTHFMELCYSKPLNRFVGIRWNYKDGKDPIHRMFHFSPRTGDLMKEAPLGTDGRYKICLAGTVVFRATMQVTCVETGELLYEFEQSNGA
jgi:hypothetical protein